MDFSELTSNVGSVTIENWCITGLDLTGVVQDDNLSKERWGFLGGIILGITTNVSSTDILYWETLNVESYVVSWDGFLEGFVMHFNGLNVGWDTWGSESNLHTGLKDTSFNSSYGNGTDTTDLVNVLKGKTKGLIKGSLGGDDSVQSFQEDGSLVPSEIGWSFDHIISVPSWNGDEGDIVSSVTNLLQISSKFLLDFLVSFLWPVNWFLVHLV